MKNSIFKGLALTAMTIVMMGLVSCGDKDEPAIYGFQYDGKAVAADATVYFTPTTTQVRDDWAVAEFMMENLTDANLETVMKVEVVSGPTELNALTICFGETCRIGTCPWTSDPFTLVPGVNTEVPVHLEYAPSVINGTSVYRITIGKGAALENPQVMYIDITGNA